MHDASERGKSFWKSKYMEKIYSLFSFNVIGLSGIVKNPFVPDLLNKSFRHCSHLNFEKHQDVPPKYSPRGEQEQETVSAAVDAT